MSAGAPTHAAALYSRPYLRDYFPGHEVYMWMDADVWVQDFSAVALYLDQAARPDIGLAITPELHRDYLLTQHRKHAEPYWRMIEGRYHELFGADVAATMKYVAMCNAGVFAMAAASAYWETFRTQLAIAAARGHAYLLNQLILNLTIQKHGAVARLPATCNWLCNLRPPLRDAATGRWTTPSPPHEEIGILHLAGINEKDAYLGRHRELLFDQGRYLDGEAIGDRAADGPET